MFLKCSPDICNWIPRYQIGYPSTFFFMHPKSYFFTFVCRRAIKSLETRIQLAELHAPLGGHLISWQQKYLKLIIPILTGHFGIQFGILRAYLGELCDNNKLTGVCVWSGFWRGGINGHGYYRLLLDRTCCSCNLDLFFSVFAALYCGDCQELADSKRQQSAVRYCKGCGGYGLGWGFQRGVTRFSVLQKGCSSSLTFTCDERLEAAGRLFYLLWAPAFFHCSCIFFFTSFTCARVGFCKWQFYRFVVDVCSLNASLVLLPECPLFTPLSVQTCLKCFGVWQVALP